MVQEFRPVQAIPSRSLRLWRRLYKRFQLEPGPATSIPDVLKTVIAVTDADKLLGDTGRKSGVSEGIGAGETVEIQVLTVPTGKRWTVYSIDISRESGDNQVDRVDLVDTSNVSAQAPIDRFTAAANHVVDLKAPVVLEPLDAILVQTDGAGVAGSTFGCNAWVFEEDMF